MKKKGIIFIGALLFLLLLFLMVSRLMTPKRILDVGSQVDNTTFQFTEEIKDEEKIAEFEKWYDSIDFSTEIEEPSGYAEIVVHIRNQDEGTVTHPVSLWIDGNDVTVTNGIGFEELGSKISKDQLDELQKFID